MRVGTRPKTELNTLFIALVSMVNKCDVQFVLDFAVVLAMPLCESE
jgi:hypothetical protein